MKKLYSTLKINRILSFLMMGMLVFSLFSSGIAYGQGAIAINCGSDTDYTALDGTVYVADVYFDGGRTDNSFTGPEYTGDILGTEDDLLYQTYRATGYTALDDHFYNIPLDNGKYNVTLKFCDYQQWQSNTGDLIIEGNQLLTSWEPVEPFTALDTTFTVKVEDGELNMHFINDDGSVGDFFINALLIEEYVPLVLGINCGSDTDYTALDGTVYVADVYFDGGTAGNKFTEESNVDPNDPILGTDDDELYMTYRKTGYSSLDDHFYNIPLDEGTYEITFKFADYQQWQRNAGDLIIEGTQVLTSFLVQDEAGGYFTALDTTFTIGVEDGELNIQFINDAVSVGDFFINGILIKEPVPYSLGINCGSDTDYIAADGKVYVADVYFDGGTAGNKFTEESNVDPNDPILGTDDDELYMTYRKTGYSSLDDHFYNVPLDEGTYEITFKFADYQQWQRNAGDLIIEGTQVLTSFLVQDEAGGYFTALDTTFTISVEDGELNIQFINDAVSVGDFFINGIYIQELSEVYYTLEGIAENGSITMDPIGGSYTSGTEVTLTAEPDYGYEFVEWTGDLEGVEDSTATTITVLMDKAKSVTAVFNELTMYTLTINVTDGNVQIDPAPDATGNKYYEGAEVLLMVKPNVGYTFNGWSGDLSGNENPVTIALDSNINVTAEISLIPTYSITLNPSTNGSVQLLPNKDSYAPGAAVVIAATADEGYRFLAWEGDLSGTQNPISVVMASDLSITATFELIPPSYALTVEATTNGSITVDPIGGTYEEGTVVTVTAVPDEGYILEAWGGDASGSDNSTTITMSADMTVSATFILETGINLNSVPTQSGLVQNYPNPFSYVTTIPYQLKEAANVKLSVYNSLGQKVSMLVNDYQAAGNYTIDWHAKDGNGKQLGSGLYIFRLEIGQDEAYVMRSSFIR